MKVAILMLNQGRGSGGVAKEHAQALLKAGHTVYFLHPRMDAGIDGATNLDISLPGSILPVHEFLPSAQDSQKAVSSMSESEARPYLSAYTKALESIINQVDIVIGHHANLTAIATNQVCKRNDKPYVLFLHGTGIEPRHLGQYDDRVWSDIEAAVKTADGLIVTTEYVRDELVCNLVDVPKEKFRIQACGVDLEKFRSGNVGEIRQKYGLKKPYVICPGALTLAKGPQNVVEASKVYSDLAETIFIGGGDLEEQLKHDLGVRGRVFGFVSDEDKTHLINGAQLLVAAPEKKEHFGIIYTEAMAGGVPAVAYEGGGVNSIIEPNTGRLTKRDPEHLGKAVRELLQDGVQRQEMSQACIERASKLYSQEVLGPGLIHWLEGILSKKDSASP